MENVEFMTTSSAVSVPVAPAFDRAPGKSMGCSWEQILSILIENGFGDGNLAQPSLPPSSILPHVKHDFPLEESKL
jgi:hypothetical protein